MLRDVKYEEIVRNDEENRIVRIQFITRNGAMDWIRVTTFITDNIKLRSDYYKDKDPKKFEKVRKSEQQRQRQRKIHDLIAASEN